MSGRGLPEIPKEWRWVRLGEATEINLGQSPPSSTYNTKGEGLPFFQGSGEFGKVYPTIKKWCTEPKKIANKGDILISVRAPVGDVNIAPVRCAIGRGLAALSPIKPMENKYFFYLLMFLKDELRQHSTGSTFDAINGDILKNFLIPLPPLPEQQKIVEILEEAFSKIEAGVEGLKKIKKLLSLYRQSVLKYAFEGRLTAEWREENKAKLEPAEELIKRIKKERAERYKKELEEWYLACKTAHREGKKKPPKPKPPKELPPITKEDLKNLPDIPKEWKWVRLGEVGTIYSGGTPSTKKPEYWGDEIPWITPADLSGYKRKYIKKGKKSISKLGLENSSAVLMPEGTVLFSSRAPIGYAAIAANPLTTNQGFKNIYPFKGILSDFIYYYFKHAKELIESMGSGTTFKEVSAKVFSSIPFPVAPLPEQQKIVEEIEYRLSIADKLEETVDKLLKLAEKLKQSYLKHAFEGKLTEEWRKQNPDLISGENSVERLLKKIKEEKKRFDKSKKKNENRRLIMKQAEKLSILEVLRKNGGQLDSKEVWKLSRHRDNIEEFYIELKKLYFEAKIEEVKTERGSILKLKT